MISNFDIPLINNGLTRPADKRLLFVVKLKAAKIMKGDKIWQVCRKKI